MWITGMKRKVNNIIVSIITGRHRKKTKLALNYLSESGSESSFKTPAKSWVNIHVISMQFILCCQQLHS